MYINATLKPLAIAEAKYVSVWNMYGHCMYSVRLKKTLHEVRDFMRHFMNKVTRQSVRNLHCECLTVPSHVCEHIYRLYYCSRRFPRWTRNPCNVLNYNMMNNSFMNFVNCCAKATNPLCNVLLKSYTVAALSTRITESSPSPCPSNSCLSLTMMLLMASSLGACRSR